mmetsp:Transcript_6345/g.22928  ORF Transcript_6345/g.22928 Transcript_6345/m.22928 type:complete len:225 (+) Transcript_6345:183-857(+)
MSSSSWYDSCDDDAHVSYCNPGTLCSLDLCASKTKGSSKRVTASGRDAAARCRHRRKKSLPSLVKCSGISGISFDDAILNIICTCVLQSLHGGEPVAISYTVHPTLQMSASNPAFCCLITSGAIQHALPLKDFPIDTRSSTLAMPKSASLILPLFSTRMFAPLMSRCTTRWECKYAKPMRICLVYTRMTFSSNLPNLVTSDAMEPPGTYSRKIYSAVSSRVMPM